jgi:DNA-binding NtrC family response regulator
VHAAQRLGIARSTLLEKIKRLGVGEPRSTRD